MNGIDKLSQSIRPSCIKKTKTLPLFCLATMTLGLSSQVLADPEDTLNFAVGADVRYEDNLFKFADGVDTDIFPGRPSKSDTIYSTNLGIKIDKPYAQQRFKLDVMATENKFQRNSFLDYTGVDYTAAWFWHLTPRVSGTILLDQKQSLVDFGDFREFDDRNVQTSQFRLFSIDGDLGAGWHAIGAISEVRARTSQNFEQIGNYEQVGVELGGKYVSRAENWISLVQRESKGKYQGRELDPIAQLDKGFDQTETEAKLYWKLTGKSTVEARLGYLDRTHDNFSQRDYDGWVGKVSYLWEPTGKLKINTSLGRNLFSFQEAGNSYYVADTFSVGPIWNVTAKTRLSLRYDLSQRDYRGAIDPAARSRDDIFQSLVFAGDWRPTRTIKVGAALQRDMRNSNIDQREYDANSVNVFAQLLF
jgi:exopolysaccharide biosynthesis operon protein EpsL